MPGRPQHVPRWAFEAVIALVVAILAILALRGDGGSGYWSDHPMLAEIVAGLLLLAIAGTAVERLLRTREERNWRGIARLACNTIGDEVTRSISATRYVRWRDAGYEPPTLDGPRSDHRTDALLPEWEVRQVPDGRDELRVRRWIALDVQARLLSNALWKEADEPDWLLRAS